MSAARCPTAAISLTFCKRQRLGWNAPTQGEGGGGHHIQDEVLDKDRARLWQHDERERGRRLSGSAQNGGTALLGGDQVAQLRLSQRSHSKNGQLLSSGGVQRVKANIHGCLERPAQAMQCTDDSRGFGRTHPPAEPHCPSAMKYERRPYQGGRHGPDYRNSERHCLDSLQSNMLSGGHTQPSGSLLWPDHASNPERLHLVART